MNTYELLTRNTEKVITEEEVSELAKDPVGKRAFIGYEPCDILDLDHFQTANKLIDLQKAGMDVVILLADVHAHLNGKGSLAEVHETAERMKAQFDTYGLDNDAVKYIYGSEFQLEADYSLKLHKLSASTTENQAKQAVPDSQGSESATVSYTLYPLMQVLDLAYLDIDLAVGGMGGREVHKLARETLPELGYEPCPFLQTPLMPDLDSGESKTDARQMTTITMDDSTTDLTQTIERAFCPPTRNPQGTRQNPILHLFEHHVFPRVDSVTVRRPQRYGEDQTFVDYEALATALESGDLHPADAKETLAEYLDQLIAPGREKLREYRSD